jgi:hypothetical protein
VPPGKFQELGEMRRSQVVTTFGPGAIVDFRAGGRGGAPVSVVAAGQEAWDESAGQDGQAGLNHPQVIKEPRLQDILKVDGFRLPPAVPTDEDGRYILPQRLIGVRFPQWLQCPGCHAIQPADGWNADPGDPALYCGRCSHGSPRRAHVVPVRFITACRKGHLDEFPWHLWVRHKKRCSNTAGPLLLVPTGPGLAGLMLQCPECEEQQSMDGCFSKKALGGLRCQGKRHWLGDSEDCTEEPRALLRGATNVYFPVIVSALDIPPWANEFHKRIAPLDWARLKAAANDAKRLAIIVANDLNVVHGLTAEEMLGRVNESLKTLETNSAETLLYDEYRQLTSGGGAATGESEFEVQPEAVPPELTGCFSRVVRVTRLREVRVLRAFTRLKPPGDWRESAGEDIPFVPIARERKNWLPATEVRGEGIFLELNREAMSTWLASAAGDEIRRRAAAVHQAFVDEYRERHGGGEPPIRVTPRLLLVHSFAHVLIRQMSLDCGYSTASLRERLYVEEGERDMCGLLVYTASADADGTLGGLCRQARADRLVSLVCRAIRSSAWCSSDPLCIEGLQSSSESLNLAACHSCMLLPETSCEKFNRLLDRAMLVGLPTPADGSEAWRKDVGYFPPFLTGTGGA